MAFNKSECFKEEREEEESSDDKGHLMMYATDRLQAILGIISIAVMMDLAEILSTETTMTKMRAIQNGALEWNTIEQVTQRLRI